MMKKSLRRREGGFTLVELMVVIVILGLLAGFGVSQFWGNLEEAKVDVAKGVCNEFEDAVTRYRFRDTETSADEIFDKMIEKKQIKADKLDDPWGERYIVTVDDDGNYVVHSKGKDKQDGTDDDVYKNGIGNGGGGDNSGF